MKRIRSIIWITSLLGVSIAVYAFMISDNANYEAEKPETQKAIRQDISSYVSATGIIKPRTGAEVRIGSRASGIVTGLYVNIGDSVKKGQLLAEIDDAELRAKHGMALANLEYAETTLKYAKLELEGMTKLNLKEYASKQSLEEAEKAVEIAQAIVSQERSNVDFSAIQLSYTKIFAPEQGVIGSVSTQKGETVSAAFSSPVFVTIIDPDRLEVRAYIDETDIGRIETGQKVSFTVDTYPETEFEGTVTAIYPQAEIQNNVVNYIVIIEIQKQKEKILRPEMTAAVTVYLQKHEDALTVPAKVLIRKNGKYYIPVLKDGKETEKEVKAGIRHNSRVEILEGIDENDKIIINNLQNNSL